MSFHFMLWILNLLLTLKRNLNKKKKSSFVVPFEKKPWKGRLSIPCVTLKTTSGKTLLKRNVAYIAKSNFLRFHNPFEDNLTANNVLSKMISHYLFSLCHLALIFTAIGPSLAQKEMCSKIFFQNIADENVNPWVQVEGVYDLLSDKDGFPVYLNNPSGLFFYYKVVTTPGTNGKFLVFGHKITEIFGLIGRLPDDFDPKTWLSSGSLNKKDLFGDVISNWLYYSPLENTFKTVQGPPYIKAMCVDDEYFRCDSGNVYLNANITRSETEVLNDPRTDYFATVPGVYSTIRPVFKHNRQNWYLYHRDGYWRVGNSYSGSATDILRIKDFALRPEYVTNHWQNWSGTEWTTESGLSIKCRGFANGENKCHGSESCNNRGSCVYTSGNEAVCLCQDSTYGPHCENRDWCSEPGLPASSVSVVHTGKRPGDIATSFCLAGYRSSPVEFYVCEQSSGSKYWMLESEATCRVPGPATMHPPPVTPGPQPHPPENPSQNQVPVGEKPSDESQAFMIFVIAFFACHIICPVFIWLGIIIAKLVHSSRTTQVGTPERLTSVDNATQGRYMLMVQVFSAFFNFTFWIWLCAVCVVLSTDEGNTRSFLFYWAVAMCGICATFVVIEAFFSRERAALHNLVSWEYIRSLQMAAPAIEMVIEWYDWKHYREAVYRTDPITGRRDYEGTTDEWKKVGKKTVRQPFLYSSWVDESNREVNSDSRPVRLSINIDITLEGEAVPSFEVQKLAFIEKTSHLNRFYEFSRKDSVPNRQPYIVLCPDKNTVPFWINEQFFWYATFLQLSWLYRWLFISQTSSAEYTLKKKIFGKPGLQQAYPDAATALSQNETPQVPAMQSGQGIDDTNQPLIDNQCNNRNYLSV